jgi:hypothetical protein
MKKFQINEVESSWRGFLVDADAKASAPLFSGATIAVARDDSEIVRGLAD